MLSGQIMPFPQLVYRIHALQRMFQRGIQPADIEAVLSSGKVIQTYPEDKPFPSYLKVGNSSGRDIHVVAADDPLNRETVIITAYLPDPTVWKNVFERRKPL